MEAASWFLQIPQTPRSASSASTSLITTRARASASPVPASSRPARTPGVYSSNPPAEQPVTTAATLSTVSGLSSILLCSSVLPSGPDARPPQQNPSRRVTWNTHVEVFIIPARDPRQPCHTTAPQLRAPAPLLSSTAPLQHRSSPAPHLASSAPAPRHSSAPHLCSGFAPAPPPPAVIKASASSRTRSAASTCAASLGDDALRVAGVRRAFPGGDDDDNARVPGDGQGSVLPDLRG